jgi:hypothetical protein
LAADLSATGGGPPQFRIGAVDVLVPWPAGYMDMAVAEPNLLSERVGSNPPGLRWVAQYMSADLLTASAEEISQSACSDFFALQVISRAENVTVVQRNFDQVRESVAEMFGSGANFRDQRFSAEFSRIAQSLSTRVGTRIDMKLVRVSRASLDAQQRDLVQFTVGYKVSVSSKLKTESLDVLTSTALVFVKGKLLTLRRLRMGNSESELQAVRNELGEWARSVLASN